MVKVKLEVESDYGPVVDTFNNVNKGIDNTQKNFNDMGNSGKKAFQQATSEADKLGNEIKDTGKKVSDLRNETKRLGTEGGGVFNNLKQGILSVFGGNLLFSVIGKVKQSISQLISLNISLDKSLKNLSAITGASGKDLKFYGEQARVMGLKIEGGAVAAVEAFKLIGSAKPELLKNKEALVEVTKAAVTLSQASGLTLPEAARNLGSALNAFSADAKDSAKFINVMAAAAQLGAQEIPFVTEALSKFGGVAKQAGVSIEESAAAIEILGAKMPEASIVGTNLRGVMIKLQILAASNGREFKSLGNELELLAPKVKDVTFLKQKFGDENLLAIQTLIAEREALGKLTEEVKGTNSAFEQAATNTDTLAQKTLEAGNAWDSFLTALGSNKAIQNQAKGFVVGFTNDLIFLSQVLTGDAFKTENIAQRELKKLTEQFVEGKIKVDEYRGAVNLLLRLNPKLIESITGAKPGETPPLQETLGIIEQLQEEIRKLTELRQGATSVADIFGLNDQIATKQKELDRLLGKSTKDILKAQEEFERALADLHKKANAAQISAASGEDRIELERKFAIEEINIEEEKFVKIGKAFDKNFKETQEQKDLFNVIRLAAERKAADDIIKLEIDKQDKLLQIAKKSNDLNLQFLNQAEQSAINGVQGSKNSQINPVIFEESKQRRILDIEEKFARERFELRTKAAKEEFDLESKKSDANVSIIQEEFALENVIIKNELDKTINTVNDARDKLNKKPFSLAASLGLTSGQFQALQGSVQDIQAISNEIFAAKNKLVDQEIAKNQELIDSRTKNIEDLKSKLQAEFDLQEEGKANNIDRINAQIKEQEDLRRIDLENEKRIKAEKLKLAKQQLITDTLIQASNLAVAATNIYLQATEEAGPYGVAIGTAAVILMVAAFAAQKVAAFNAINDNNKTNNNFAEGVIDLQGPGTGTSDSIPANLSKGESVMTAKETKENMDLLLGIRNDDEKMMKEGILDLIRSRGIRLEDDIPGLLLRKKESIRGGTSGNYSNSGTENIENELKELKTIVSKFMNQSRDKTYTDQEGNLVKKIGSHTTIYRKK